MTRLIIYFSTLVAVTFQLTAGSDLTHFELVKSRRCIGGNRVGHPGDTAEMCAAICLAAPECVGFNYVAGASLCVARAAGCEETEDNNCVYYKRKERHGKANQVAAELEQFLNNASAVIQNFTLAMLPSNESATVEVRLAPAIADWLPKFSKDEGKRCVGGGRIGEQTEGSEKCALTCLAAPECAGFNFDKSNSLCVARSSDCSEVDDETSVFYRKLGGGGAATIGTTVTVLSALTESTPVTSKDTQPLDIAVQSNLDNFEQLLGQKCAGPRLGDQANSVEKCAAVCLESSECSGFNFIKGTEICACRSKDCTITDDAAAIYFRKKGQPSLPTIATPVTPQPSITTATYPSVSSGTTAALPPGADGSMASYKVITGKRCAGGVPLGEPAHLVDRCATICSYALDCAGFNFLESNCSCIAVSQGCSQTDDAGAIFYKKTVQDMTGPPPVVTLATARAATAETTVKVNDSTDTPIALTSVSTLISSIITKPALPSMITPGFTVKEKTRCSGGTSKSVGVTTGVDQCNDLCKNNPDCFGFNFSASSSTCVLRSVGCEEQEAGEDISFYQKNPPS